MVVENKVWFVLFYCFTVYLEMIEAPDLENPIRGSHIRITPYHVIVFYP